MDSILPDNEDIQRFKRKVKIKDHRGKPIDSGSEETLIRYEDQLSELGLDEGAQSTHPAFITTIEPFEKASRTFSVNQRAADQQAAFVHQQSPLEEPYQPQPDDRKKQASMNEQSYVATRGSLVDQSDRLMDNAEVVAPSAYTSRHAQKKPENRTLWLFLLLLILAFGFLAYQFWLQQQKLGDLHEKIARSDSFVSGYADDKVREFTRGNQGKLLYQKLDGELNRVRLALETTLSDLSMRLNKLADSVNGLSSNERAKTLAVSPQLAGEIVSLKKQLTTLKESFVKIEESSEQGFARFSARISALENHNKQLGSRLARATERQNKLDKNADQLRQHFLSANASAAENGGSAAKLNKIEAELARLQKQLRSTSASVAKLHSGVPQTGSDSVLRAQISGLNKEVAQLKDGIRSVDQFRQASNSRIITMERRLNDLLLEMKQSGG